MDGQHNDQKKSVKRKTTMGKTLHTQLNFNQHEPHQTGCEVRYIGKARNPCFRYRFIVALNDQILFLNTKSSKDK